MFIEPNIKRDGEGKGCMRSGWIEVICGSMFSGKTEELIRRLNRALIAGQRVEIFKPDIDKRYSDKEIVSHNKRSIRSTPVQSAHDILLLSSDSDVVGIDEAQFFDKRLISVTSQLADNGKRVIVAGLDMDFKGQPFEPVPSIMATAEYVTKFSAICMSCGSAASFSARIITSDEKVLIGEHESYESRCRKCFKEHLAKENKA